MNISLITNLILKHTKGSKAVKGNWIFGANKKNEAMACTISHDNLNGYLTMAIHKEILREAKELGLNKPLHIYGTVNAGPNGSKSYEFEQLTDDQISLICNQ